MGKGWGGWILAVGLAACGVSELPEGESCTVVRSGVRVQTEAQWPLGGMATLRAEGLQPGEVARWWWSPLDRDHCSCPEGAGSCLALELPALLGEAVAGEDGRAELVVELSPDLPLGPRRVQALTDQGASAVRQIRITGGLHGEKSLDDASFILRGPGIAEGITAVGDLDGSGRPSVALAAPSRGEVWILPPSCCPSPGRAVDEVPEATRIVGPPSLGAALVATGDLNGDGMVDLALSAPETEMLYLMPGPFLPGSWDVEALAAQTLRVPGGAWDLAAVDLDGDGLPELLVAGPDRLWRVQDGLLIEQERGLDSPTVVALGDLDGDGREDAALGNGDAVGIHFGPGFTEWALHAPGAVLARPGDLDGDGRPDLLLGAPDAQEGRGEVQVMHGPMSPAVRLLTGDGPDDRLGARLIGPGDLDGDGRGEVAVYSESHGAVLVFYGPLGTEQTLGQARARIDTPGLPVLAGAGDLIGEGFASLAIGISSLEGDDAVYFFRGGPGN